MLVHRRPAQGHDHLRWRERLPGRGRAALADLPGLRDIAVIGVPDEKWGEAVVAVVSLEPGASITSNDVRDHARETPRALQAAQPLMVVEACHGTPLASWTRAPSVDSSVRPVPDAGLSVHQPGDVGVLASVMETPVGQVERDFAGCEGGGPAHARQRREPACSATRSRWASTTSNGIVRPRSSRRPGPRYWESRRRG